MSTSIPFFSPLGSPSFIEQQQKSRLEKSSSETQISLPSSSSIQATACSRIYSPKKTPEKRIPSFITALSPKKIKYGPRSPQDGCPASPVKSAAAVPSQEAAWNTFIPLHFCRQPFEQPHNSIQTMMDRITAFKTLPPLLTQGRMLAAIVELALTMKPDLLVHYKKDTPLIHPAYPHNPTPGLAGSFFAASLADKIYVMVSNRKLIARGSLGKVTEAAGLVFKRNGLKILFEGCFDVVKHTVALQDCEDETRDAVVQRVRARIQAATDLAGVPHVTNPVFHGVLLSQKRSKIIMMYPRFGGDLLAYHNEHVLSEEQRLLNTLKVAEHLGAALKGIHARKYVHRDIKEENLLVNWTPKNLIETVELADFDLSTNNMGKTLCGTFQFLAPEMMAMAFKDEKIAKALGVEDLSTLLGPSLDSWGFGLVLHKTLYDRMPEHVLQILDYMNMMNEIQGAPEEHVNYLKGLVKDIKDKWIQTMLDAIELEKKVDTSVPVTCDSLIQSLLFVDPRKRPNDAAIGEMVLKLKDSFKPGALQS